MDNTYLRTLGPGEFWFKSNIVLNELSHGGKTIAYRVTHLVSGKVYVGWMGDAYRGLKLMASRLTAGNFPNPQLQALVQQDNACELEVVLLDSRLNQDDALDTLRNVMDDWMITAGPSLILNGATLPPRKLRPGQVRRTRAGASSPKLQSRLRKLPEPKPPKPPKEPKARATQQPWKNLHISRKNHSASGAFKLLHVASGQWFVGASKNVCDSLLNLSNRLRAGKAGNPELQRLFLEDPLLELTLELKEDESQSMADNAFLANALALQWLKELEPNAQLLSKAKVYGRTTLESRTPRSPSFARGECMYQVTTKATDGAALPKADLLHDAWFSYQRRDSSMGA